MLAEEAIEIVTRIVLLETCEFHHGELASSLLKTLREIGLQQRAITAGKESYCVWKLTDVIEEPIFDRSLYVLELTDLLDNIAFVLVLNKLQGIEAEHQTVLLC